MTHDTRWAAVAAALLLAGAGGCGAEVVVEDRGPALTPTGTLAHSPNWSPDGTEIYFFGAANGTTSFGPSLNAVSMTGNVRIVDEGKEQYSSLAVSPDGTVYYAAGPERDLFSTAAAEPLPIALGPHTDVVAISPEGGRIAYFGDTDPIGPFGQLKLLSLADGGVMTLSDVQPGANSVEFDNDRVLAFSPAGDRLFYLADLSDGSAFGGSGLVFDLATGAATTKTWDLGYNPLVHWGAGGLRLAAVPPDASYEILNLDTAELVSLPAAPLPEPLTDVWSPDGSRIAYWTTSCLDSCGLFCCSVDRIQRQLVVADVTTGQVRRIAAAGDLTIPNGLGSIYGGISFSPDGTRIAYGIEGRIHVRDVP